MTGSRALDGRPWAFTVVGRDACGRNPAEGPMTKVETDTSDVQTASDASSRRGNAHGRAVSTGSLATSLEAIALLVASRTSTEDASPSASPPTHRRRRSSPAGWSMRCEAMSTSLPPPSVRERLREACADVGSGACSGLLFETVAGGVVDRMAVAPAGSRVRSQARASRMRSTHTAYCLAEKWRSSSANMVGSPTVPPLGVVTSTTIASIPRA